MAVSFREGSPVYSGPSWEDPHLESMPRCQNLHRRGSGFFDRNGAVWDRDTYCLRFDDAILEGYESREASKSPHYFKTMKFKNWDLDGFGGGVFRSGFGV